MTKYLCRGCSRNGETYLCTVEIYDGEVMDDFTFCVAACESGVANFKEVI